MEFKPVINLKLDFNLSSRAIAKVQAAIIIVVILVAVAGAAYYFSASKTATTTVSTSQLPTSLVVEEESQPDSMDPAVAYTTPGWEIVEQVYQGLLAPNGTKLHNLRRFVGQELDCFL